MPKFFLITFILFFNNIGKAQILSNTYTLEHYYRCSFEDLSNIISTNCLFKDAVFIVENTYLQNQLDKSKFSQFIEDLKGLSLSWIQYNPVKEYKYSDSIQLKKNMALYKVFKDTIKLISTDNKSFLHIPFSYDFNDFFGNADWKNMFVTKLLATHSGNCHSLPYLYKILADELGAKCWLALAPNHIYIKNRCKSICWYNTELTSGSFPVDAWIMASGYLPLQAIQNGIYMDTLSNQECIALCVVDLAKGYEHQTHNYFDSFIIKCCDLSLKYFPKNVQAMLLKAETLKQVFLKEQKDQFPKPTITFDEMQDMYVKLYDLGYREMPEKMYLQWLQSVNKEKDKYSDKRLQQTLESYKNK